VLGLLAVGVDEKTVDSHGRRRALEHGSTILALELAKEGGGVEIEQVVREGQSTDVLVEESAKAEMLVLGSRGRGGFRELMLGSVSQQCAHHARCPVTIVRTGCECPPAAELAPE